MFLAINSFGQVLTGKLPGVGIQDSTNKKLRSLSMFNNHNLIIDKDINQDPIPYIDGKQVSMIEISSINPKFFNTATVEKKELTINGKKSNYQIYFTTNDNYQSKRISLKDIRKKYAIDQSLACFYFMDGGLVKVDEVDIFLDENNILEISCHLFESNEEKLKLNIIEIFTKSEKNIENSKPVIIIR